MLHLKFSSTFAFHHKKGIRVMGILYLNSKSDLVGAFASILCLVHCLATPFLFAAHAGIANHSEVLPQWWGLFDIIFLVISFGAIWWSGKTTSKKWIGNVLWLSWIVLALIVLNEKFSFFDLAEQTIYMPTISLIFFHLYNRKYCHCGEEHCCVDENGNA